MGLIIQTIEGNDTYHLLFSITFNKPYNSPSKIATFIDEVLIKTIVKWEDNVFYFSYTNADRKFKVKGYNNIEEINIIVNSIIEQIINMYSIGSLTFGEVGISYRNLS
ncbi:MAG: hypothetical protein H8D45_26245 [Bacteroidetes bacterium]|nr:hypothetical protein [Bacteroidota bacterium]